MVRDVIVFITLALLIFFSADLYADPEPLPPDPDILILVEQLSADTLFRDVSAMVDFYTRHTYSDTVSATTGIGAARSWVRDRFIQTGSNISFYPWAGYWSGQPWSCYNVKGLNGEETPQNPLIVLGGHLDSRTVSSSNVTGFAPGADDDASGVAAQLEISRLISAEPLNLTVSMNAFTGEEQGLLGATAYANQLNSGGYSVKAMLNMDMIGHIVHPTGAVDSTTLRCFSGPPHTSSSRQLARYVKWVGEAYSDGLTVNLINALDRPGRSGDHAAFYNQGFPAVRIMETAEDVAYQHGNNDIPGNMSFSYAGKIARLVLGVTLAIAKSENVEFPAPEVTNSGTGESLIISWPDSLTPPPGGLWYVAYRPSDSLYWEDVAWTELQPPFELTGLTEGVEYAVSISFSDEDGVPALFGLESMGTPLGAIPPENFESTSTPDGVRLNWDARPEPNIREYIIERDTYTSAFTEVAVIPHPGEEWFDDDLLGSTLYFYRIKTRTTEGVTGPPGDIVKGRLATHSAGIMIFDATPDGTGPPSAPTDEEVDNFYYDTIGWSWVIDEQWDRADSMAVGVELSDADMADNELVFVHIDALFASIAEDTTAFRKYLQNGGKLFITGWRMSSSVCGLTGYEHSLGQGDFLYDLAGIDSIRVATNFDDNFIGSIGLLNYGDVDFDHQSYPYWNNVLPFNDAIWTENLPEHVEVISEFRANLPISEFYGRPVALQDSSHVPNWVLVDMPLYYMDYFEAYGFIEQVLEAMDAPWNGVDPLPGNEAPNGFRLYPPYPNPTNSSVSIDFFVPHTGKLKLAIYNVEGKLVDELCSGSFIRGEQQVNFNAEGLTSGIYFIAMEAGDFKSVRKLAVLK